jgi:hypothetical protein
MMDMHTTPAADHRHDGTHRHSGTRRKQGPDEPRTDEEIRTDVRRWEVRCLTEEIHAFGLRPPLGLRCVLDLFIDGRATHDQVQGYLDLHLAAPVSSLVLEVNHA